MEQITHFVARAGKVFHLTDTKQVTSLWMQRVTLKVRSHISFTRIHWQKLTFPSCDINMIQLDLTSTVTLWHLLIVHHNNASCCTVPCTPTNTALFYLCFRCSFCKWSCTFLIENWSNSAGLDLYSGVWIGWRRDRNLTGFQEAVSHLYVKQVSTSSSMF